MKVKYDLHIHSKLSKCADVLSTPNNILNMCMLKGLNLVAVTDHNSLKQIPTLAKIAPSYDFLFLYGVEVSTFQHFHILAYFETLEQALAFDAFLEAGLDKNIRVMSGFRQTLYNEYDDEIGDITYDLSQDSIYAYDVLAKKIRFLSGIIVLAHIDRKCSGIMDCVEKFADFDFDAIEICDKKNVNEIYKRHPYLHKYRVFYNSDSHDIVMINEKEEIELEELSFRALKKWLKDE